MGGGFLDFFFKKEAQSICDGTADCLQGNSSSFIWPPESAKVIFKV